MRTQTVRRRALLAMLGLAGLSSVALAAGISGAGATFPYPIYAKWAEAYREKSGVSLNYQSIGSGAGIRQIKAATVTFGASDKPLSAAELAKDGLVQFPMVIGGVVPVINVPGVKAGEILLDGATLADIYLGVVSSWDDARIRALNPKVSLPRLAIAPIYRSDGSGTNFLFTSYLSGVSARFRSAVGASTSVEWPAGIGAKGNEGVANMTALTRGAIGYVEYAYARQNRMAYLRLRNRDGKTVAPDAAAFAAAASNAGWSETPAHDVVLVDQPGPESWPITGASFIIMQRRPKDPMAAGEALKFFAWAYRNGGALARSLDYVPLPENVVRLVEDTWRNSIVSGGRPIWPVRP